MERISPISPRDEAQGHKLPCTDPEGNAVEKKRREGDETRGQTHAFHLFRPTASNTASKIILPSRSASPTGASKGPGALLAPRGWERYFTTALLVQENKNEQRRVNVAKKAERESRKFIEAAVSGEDVLRERQRRWVSRRRTLHMD